MSRAGSYVDESLFGPSRAEKRKTARTKGKALRGGAAGVLGQTDQKPLMLLRSEYERIKKLAILNTPAQMQAQRAQEKLVRDKEMKQAYDRKQQMMRKEEIRKRNLPPSKYELREKAKKDDVRKRAQHLRNEQQDDVKAMNQMMQYAQTVAVRDAQLQEKKDNAYREQLEERRRDLKMELERLTKVKYFKDREDKRRRKELEDADVIQIQIADNAGRRVKLLETKKQEQFKVKRRARELEAQEQAAGRVKKREAKKLLDDIVASNAAMKEVREQRKLADIEEDRKIQRYLEEKDAREAALEEEKAKKAAQKEREVAALRAQQKKQSDKQAALDALRAKRAAEAKEREARQREMREAQKAHSAQEELQEARRKQALAREHAHSSMLIYDKQEFDRNNAVMTKQMKEFRAEEERKHALRVKNAKEIRDQISVREVERRERQKKFIMEGRTGQQSTLEELGQLNALKQEKIEQLQAMGVPDKYVSELGNYDPKKALLNDYKRGGKW